MRARTRRGAYSAQGAPGRYSTVTGRPDRRYSSTRNSPPVTNSRSSGS